LEASAKENGGLLACLTQELIRRVDDTF
jgi:hypothetical protein